MVKKKARLVCDLGTLSINSTNKTFCFLTFPVGLLFFWLWNLFQLFILNCHYGSIVFCLKAGSFVFWFLTLCSETLACPNYPISLIAYSTTSFTTLLLQAVALWHFTEFS